MCAVIGAYLPEVSREGLAVVKRLFAESEIRGLHATGATYYQGGQLHTIRDTIKGSDFFERYDIEMMIDEGQLRLIGHCRYSTSDLEFNQPMLNESMALVHNGVISQESPKRWKELFGYDFQTRNDSEILLQSLTHEHSFERWTEASISCCYMNKDGELFAYRNGKRPLHFAEGRLGLFVASTKDIISRAGLPSSEPIQNGEKIRLTNFKRYTIQSSDNDLQKVHYVR